MIEGIHQAGFFLVYTLGNLYIIVVLLRLVLQARGANFFNPIAYAVFQMTQPFVRPLQKFVPGYKGIDGSIVVLLLGTELIKLILILAISASGFPNIAGLIGWAILDVIDLVLSFYFFAIIIHAIASWITQQYNSLLYALAIVVEPLLQPARRLIPALGGLDLSPIAVLILIHLTQMILIEPWLTYTQWMTISG